MPEERDIVPEEKWVIKKGQQIGRLTLIGPVYYQEDRKRGGRIARAQFGWFECCCHERNKKYLRLASVKSKDATSCGCYKKERMRARLEELHKNNRKGTLAKDGKKKCSSRKCVFAGIEQPINSFHKNNKTADGFSTICKDCSRRNIYKWRHKRSFEDFEKQLQSQNYLCDFCGLPMKESDKRLGPVQDHNHYTKELRGVVHNVCNLMIEQIETFPDLFCEDNFGFAYTYLRKWEEISKTEEQEQCLTNAV